MDKLWWLMSTALSPPNVPRMLFLFVEMTERHADFAVVTLSVIVSGRENGQLRWVFPEAHAIDSISISTACRLALIMVVFQLTQMCG